MWDTPPRLVPTESLNETHQKTLSFLDACEHQFGINSVVYISFGTFYGMSSRVDLIEMVLHSLLHSKKPFVYAVNKLKMFHSTEIQAEMERSPTAHMTDFSPQHHVLAHPATGWFLVRFVTSLLEF